MSNSFPSVGLVPKEETNALSFIKKYPHYDGRGVVMAIFDTGVDPGAAGLQVTSDGKPKIIDIISATTDNNVDTSKIVIMDGESKTITGLTGRKLTIPDSWCNPTGKWHVGVKNGYELYPKDIRTRMQKEFMENEFLPQLRELKVNCLKELEVEEKLKSSSGKSVESTTSGSGDKNKKNVPVEKLFESKLIKDDLRDKVDITSDENYTDLGPTYDCIVFHDGNTWRACIDVTATGDLDKCKVMGTYKETLEYGFLSERDQLNYSFNIYDNGNLLEINCVSSPHGTHVASIAAANFPDEPERNGIAPGVQLISVKIGESRLGGGMETGTAIIKACLRAIESKVDVINMSFGESVAWAGGRCHNFMNETVEKHGIIYVTSAGNNGPNISTVGASSLPDFVMSIGAYVSPGMMEVEYSLPEQAPGMMLTFTSKDPNIVGGRSVAFSAPGAAIASFPNCFLSRSHLANGTSMATPNAAGGVALILSGLKQLNLPYSPFSIKRSIQNTAFKPSNYEPLAMGNGLLQVDAAFNHAVKFNNIMERDVTFKVTCSEPTKRGIYLREEADFMRPIKVPISIKPSWLNNDDYDNGVKNQFEMKLFLICDAPWVVSQDFLVVTNSTRNIYIKVDATKLEPGTYFDCLKAYDSTDTDKGPIFQIPITVAKPTPLEENGCLPWRTLVLKPGFSNFTHVIPPVGTSIAKVKVKNIGTDPSGRIVFGLRQLRPDSCGKDLKEYISINPGVEECLTFPIQSQRAVTITVTQWWSSLEDSLISYSVEFGGAQMNSQEVTMIASSGYHKVELFCSSPRDTIQPQVSLTHSVTPLKPVEDKITPLTSRDILPGGKQIHGLQLSYNFNLPKDATVSCMVPIMDTLLYENEYVSFIWQLFDCNKQFLFAGEAYPKRSFAEFDHYSGKLSKGDYIVKLQIRHENVSFLKKLVKMPIHLVIKLPSSASLDIFSSRAELLRDGEQFESRTINEKQLINVFIKSFANDKIPKNLPNLPGSFLCGKIYLTKGETSKNARAYLFSYILNGGENSKKPEPKDKDSQSLQEKFLDAFVDFKALWISKLEEKYESLIPTDEDNLQPEHKHQLITAKLKSLNSIKDKSIEQYEKMIALADKIINFQDPVLFNRLLLEAKSNAKMFSDSEAKDKKNDSFLKSKEKQKDHLCEALYHKGVAILALLREAPAEKSSLNSYSIQQVDEIVRQLATFDELSNVKYHNLIYQHALAKSQYGRAVKSVLKQMESKSTREFYDQLIEAADLAGWNFISQFFKRVIHVRFPIAFRPS